jgi:2-(3-amino-3-carboxypropyl)histidine synthase
LDDYRNVCVVSTAQHLNQLDLVRELLESRGKKVWVAGQILGCSQNNAAAFDCRVDAFLCVGSGSFHPVGLLAGTTKPVFVLNPYAGSMARLPDAERERFFRRRRGRLAKALSAESFGVLISTKDGQFDMKTALGVSARLRSAGKRVFLFAGDELRPDNLAPFKVDCWVNTACPRLVDDFFDAPIVNASELSGFI